MFALRRFAPTFSASSARAFSSSPSSHAAKFSLVGRLSRPAELKTTARGEEFVSYSVATRDSTKPDATVSFYNVSKFQLTDGIKNMLLSLPKGTLLHVSADASHNKKEGEQIPRLLLRQRDLEVLSKPRTTPENGYGLEQQNGEQY